MSEQEGERLIREIRNLKGVGVLVVAVAAVFVGFWINSQVGGRNPTVILERELKKMNQELEMVHNGLKQSGGVLERELTKLRKEMEMLRGAPPAGKKGPPAI